MVQTSAAQPLEEYISEVGSKFCVLSHKTKKSLGCYDTKGEAENRLVQIQMFKHMHERMDCPFCRLGEDAVTTANVQGLPRGFPLGKKPRRWQPAPPAKLVTTGNWNTDVAPPGPEYVEAESR